VQTLQKEEKMTVFLTTHYMEEAADADNVIIIDRGSIVAEGTPHELKNRYTGDFITLYGVSEENVKTLNCPYRAEKGAFIVTVKNTAFATELIIKHKEIFNDYEITKGDMDDVFLSVTGKELGGDEK
jgi:multidrug/hemolysin transport system ATP-binding protein